MKKGLIELVFVLDKSGSTGGFSRFDELVAEQ
jgi:hypothetical protein